MDAPHVYVHAWALGSFHCHISTQTFLGVLAMSVDSCMEIKNAPFSGITKSGRVWRKVPESDARSVGSYKLQTTGKTFIRIDTRIPHHEALGYRDS